MVSPKRTSSTGTGAKRPKRKPKPESDPRYPVALLQTAFEMRQKADPHFQEILNGIMEGLEIAPQDFETYLSEYREDLRKNCRKKGYA